MLELLVRSGILVCVCLLIGAAVWGGRRYVAAQRRRALDAFPLDGLAENAATSTQEARIHILAFSSEDCSQCHTLQAPALRRIQESYGDKVTVIEVDAPSQPVLTERYRVLTLPTTVVLDAGGRAHAINYGFANVQRLCKQVDEMLGQSIA
jgi:thioredoxin-like negative regulator of GroEL